MLVLNNLCQCRENIDSNKSKFCVNETNGLVV
jgi:hypothetical protein